MKKSREQVGRRYYRRAGNEFRPSYDSGTRSYPSEPTKAAPKTAGAAKPKKQRSASSAPKTTAKTASASAADGVKNAAAATKLPRETVEKPTAAAPEKPSTGVVPDAANAPTAPEPAPKTPQEVEAERQQKFARLRTKLRAQVCAIHADVPLPPDREQGSEAAEQQLHILLYQTDVPEAELNAALSDLRAQRRREKAQYQGAPFADVFQVELILSEEDSDRA